MEREKSSTDEAELQALLDLLGINKEQLDKLKAKPKVIQRKKVQLPPEHIIQRREHCRLCGRKSIKLFHMHPDISETHLVSTKISEIIPDLKITTQVYTKPTCSTCRENLLKYSKEELILSLIQQASEGQLCQEMK